MSPMNPRLLRPLARRQAPAPTDPYFSQVSLLLHFDGSLTDSSSHGHTVSVVGTADLTTTTSKFGTGSAGFTGSGYLEVPAHSSLDMGNGDFTIEYWFSPVAPRGGFYPAHIATTSSYQSGVFGIGYDRGDNPGDLWAFYDTTSTAPDFFATPAPPPPDWHHVAVVRNGNSLLVFVDGADVGSATLESTDTLDLALGGALGIGGGSWDGAASYTNDAIDEVRITKGVARYTANFTPPTAAFPNQ